MESLLEYFPYVSVAAIVILIVEVWLRNYKLPPGPWGWPILGSYFNMDKLHYLTFTELHKKYGEIFSFRSFGGTTFIVLNGMDIIKEVLVSRADEFIGRPLEINFMQWLDDGYGVLQEEGKAWKEQRRFFLSTAKVYGFGRMDLEGFMHERMQEMVIELKKLGQKPVDVHRYLAYVTGNVISKVLCSKRFSMDDSKYHELIENVLNMVLFFSDRRMLLTNWIVQPLLNLTPSGRIMKKTKRELEKFTDDIVDEHVRTIDIKHPRDFIDSYLIYLKSLEEKGELKDSTFSLTRLRKVFYGMFLEGSLTVSSTTVSLLGTLSKHVDVQKKAQKQLDDVVGRERLPSWSDKKNLPYVEAVMLELYRTSIIFAVSTYYSNFEQTTIRGYRIPKRSFIVANLYSVNNDPKTYPDPSRFDPGRFLSEDGKRMKQEAPIPFGVGKRSCIGESLAQMEVFLFICMFLHHFTIYPAEDYKFRLVPRE